MSSGKLGRDQFFTLCLNFACSVSFLLVSNDKYIEEKKEAGLKT
jgi:hypothetical protein